MRINLTSVLVDDQDKALRFYTEVLGFVKKTEVPLGEHRWLTVVSADDPDGVEHDVRRGRHFRLPGGAGSGRDEAAAPQVVSGRESGLSGTDHDDVGQQRRSQGDRFAGGPGVAGQLQVRLLGDQPT